MPYDEHLAGCVRALLAGDPDVTEKRMFGGLAFMVDGAMAVAASGQGGLMVRVDPQDSDALVDGQRVSPVVMRGRAMRGWLRVDSEALHPERDLEAWVRRGVAYARSLQDASS
jgi:TfoX/Sxy family transcriptional regulator of competence genes